MGVSRISDWLVGGGGGGGGGGGAGWCVCVGGGWQLQHSSWIRTSGGGGCGRKARCFGSTPTTTAAASGARRRGTGTPLRRSRACCWAPSRCCPSARSRRCVPVGAFTTVRICLFVCLLFVCLFVCAPPLGAVRQGLDIRCARVTVQVHPVCAVSLPCGRRRWGLDRQAAPLFLPSLLFVAAYSYLPHKELRFVLPAAPMLFVVAAHGAAKL